MVNPFSSLLLVIFIVTTGLILVRSKRLFRTFSIVFGIVILILASSLPAIAAPNFHTSVRGDVVQVQESNTCQFKESCLCTDSEFKGLCVAQGQNGSQSDEDIVKAIKSQASDDNELIVHVDNGAVILSGSVKDEAAARSLIKKVEQLPGVHYITVELGLVNPSNRKLS